MTEPSLASAIRLGVGADELGAPLKNYLVRMLANDSNFAMVRDYSEGEADPTCPYPVVAIRVAQAVALGEIDRGILVCGTGIGMSIAANKVPGVRAAVVHDGYSAERSVLSNNCQIMTLGARIIADVSAHRLVKEWLGYEFDPGSASAAKLQVIEDYERASGKS
ncbi:MAG: RpiB/LacA/LacB family sugar-phosphate isomerase [Acidimicrobiales bacterium]|jgi:ribose 5-phosphate isomerase B